MRGLLFLTLFWLVAQLGNLVFDMKGQHPGDLRSHRDVRLVLERWPSTTRNIADQMISRYGEPDQVVDDQLWWHPRGRAAIVLYRDRGAGPPID